MHFDALRLAGLQVYFRKVFEFLQGPLRGAVFVRHVELDDFCTCCGACIRHIHRDGELRIIRHGRSGELYISHAKGRVGETVPEGPADGHFLLLIVAVAHEDAFRVVHGLHLAREVQVGGVVGQLHGEGLRQVAGGIDLAVEEAVRGLAGPLAAEIHFENGCG